MNRPDDCSQGDFFITNHTVTFIRKLRVMARERRASGKTSFGKRTQAEKNFRGRKSNKPERDSGSEDRPRRRPFANRDEKPSARRSYNNPRRKSQDERGGSGAGFRGRPDRFSKFERDEKRGEFSKPRRDKPFGDRKDKPSFRKREEGSERGFGKRGEGFGGKKMEKTSFRKRDESGERRFGRKEEAGQRKFSRSDVRKVDDRFSKFKKNDGDERPPFSKSERKERSSNYGKPFRAREKKKSLGGLMQEHQRKNIDAGLKSDDGLIRLNKFMANSGVGSRREADEFIKMGLVTVNGVTITEMGHKVKPTDDVRYEGRKLKAEPLVYVLLNKPKGFITTTDDPEERNTVMDLVANACKERIYPVGRLDRNTTGLLLLTNDGDLADKLTHPSYNVKKIYKVELNRPLSKNDFQKILDGVYFEEGKAQVDDLAIVSDDGKEIGIELHIGWNRIVRRIFEALGYEVERLDRVVYAGLDKKDLGRGQWRFLKPEEVVTLKHFR